MKVLLIAALTVSSLSFLQSCNKSPAEKDLEQQKEEVEHSTEVQQDRLDTQEEQYSEGSDKSVERFEDRTEARKDSLEESKDRKLEVIEDREEQIED